MRKVLKYEADDGTLCDTEKQALNRDEFLKLEKWYEDNKLYGNYLGCRIEWEDLLEWLRENKAEVAKILTTI